jgi:hypothetical protein
MCADCHGNYGSGFDITQRVVSFPPHLKAFGKREQGSCVPGDLTHESQGSCGQLSREALNKTMLFFFSL